MRSKIIATAALLLAFTSSAEAQDCTNSVYNSYQCNNGARLTPTWNGGYQTDGGTTWNRNSLDNGWNSSTGGTIRQNSYGNYVTGGGTTWSQTPLGGWSSSGGKQCAQSLLGGITCN